MVIYLSHYLNSNTPSYGSRHIFDISKKSSICCGDTANDSYISSTVHIGTHIDMPYHFHENGQTIKNYKPDFWFFNNILVVEIEPKDYVIENELVDKLDSVKRNDIDFLIVITGLGKDRHNKRYTTENYGFHSNLAPFLRKKFPDLRLFGFDSISVSSFQDRMEGRKAHRAFLNPDNPILLMEDMDLSQLRDGIQITSVIVAPMLIEDCDGLPCTIIGELSV